jgi:hypothetical protein
MLTAQEAHELSENNKKPREHYVELWVLEIEKEINRTCCAGVSQVFTHVPHESVCGHFLSIEDLRETFERLGYSLKSINTTLVNISW